jgi:hypothetical protein
MLVTVNSRDLMAKQRRWRHDIPIVMMRDALLRGHRREGRRLGRSGREAGLSDTMRAHEVAKTRRRPPQGRAWRSNSI